MAVLWPWTGLTEQQALPSGVGVGSSFQKQNETLALSLSRESFRKSDAQLILTSIERAQERTEQK